MEALYLHHTNLRTRNYSFSRPLHAPLYCHLTKNMMTYLQLDHWQLCFTWGLSDRILKTFRQNCDLVLKCFCSEPFSPLSLSYFPHPVSPGVRLDMKTRENLIQSIFFYCPPLLKKHLDDEAVTDASSEIPNSSLTVNSVYTPAASCTSCFKFKLSRVIT